MNIPAKDFDEAAERMIALGRGHGFILGLKRANEILRKHGILSEHPARSQIFREMMDCDQDGVTAYSKGAFNADSPKMEKGK